MKKLLVLLMAGMLISGVACAQEGEPYVDPNPVTEVRTKTETSLVVERTHRDPVTATTTYNIVELEAEIAKLQGVVDLWQDKIDPLQAIIDEYNLLEIEE